MLEQPPRDANRLGPAGQALIDGLETLAILHLPLERPRLVRHRSNQRFVDRRRFGPVPPGVAVAPLALQDLRQPIEQLGVLRDQLLLVATLGQHDGHFQSSLLVGVVGHPGVAAGDLHQVAYAGRVVARLTRQKLLAGVDRFVDVAQPDERLGQQPERRFQHLGLRAAALRRAQHFAARDATSVQAWVAPAASFRRWPIWAFRA